MQHATSIPKQVLLLLQNARFSNPRAQPPTANRRPGIYLTHSDFRDTTNLFPQAGLDILAMASQKHLNLGGGGATNPSSFPRDHPVCHSACMPALLAKAEDLACSQYPPLQSKETGQCVATVSRIEANNHSPDRFEKLGQQGPWGHDVQNQDRSSCQTWLALGQQGHARI